MNDLVPEIEKRAGSRLAGVFLEWEPGPVLVVSLTKGPQVDSLADLAQEATGGQISLRYNALTSLKDRISQLERARHAAAGVLQAPVAGYVDEKAERVVVVLSGNAKGSLGARGADAEAVRETLMDMPFPVELEHSPGVESDESRGGRHLTSCTSGFTVVNASGEKGYLTAGHCASTQSYMHWADGSWHSTSYVAQRWDASRDVQWHKRRSGGLAFQAQFHVSTTAARPQEGLYGYATGSALCKWGSRSKKLACGEVISKAFAPASCGADNVACRPVFTRVALAAGETCRGDSGGPWFIGRRAAGVHSGAGPYHSSSQVCAGQAGGQVFAYFTPISTALSSLSLALLIEG